jgi:endonuclease YncB( thermonuclease family)
VQADGIREGAGVAELRFLAIAILLVTAPAAAQDQLIGRASIIDGHTIEIHDERIRFNGVDAPESWQKCQDKFGREYRCGRASAEALDTFLAASRPTRCEFIERDRYGRFVGKCYRADGLSVAEWLVRNGHALDWPKYSGGAYARDQAKAKRERRGIILPQRAVRGETTWRSSPSG